MADTREYKMTITLRGVNSEKNGTGGDASDEAATQPTSASDTLKNIIKQTKSIAVATGASMIAKQALDYVSSRVEIETGNSRVQGQIDAAKQIGSQAASVVMAGIVGGLPAVGLALFGIGLGYAKDFMTYNFEKSQNDAMLAIQRERAGLAWAANAQRRL